MVKKTDSQKVRHISPGPVGAGGRRVGGGQRPQGAAVEMLTNTETFAFGNEFLGFGPAL